MDRVCERKFGIASNKAIIKVISALSAGGIKTRRRLTPTYVIMPSFRETPQPYISYIFSYDATQLLLQLLLVHCNRGEGACKVLSAGNSLRVAQIDFIECKQLFSLFHSTSSIIHLLSVFIY